jgi:hypothetical protein
MWWWWYMPHGPSKQQCPQAHETVERAASNHEKSTEEVVASTREARHGAKNVRMLMGALARKLEKANEHH